MTTVDFTQTNLRPLSRARVLDLDDFDPVQHGTQSPPASRIGVALFWAAVGALIAARIVLFDPAAPRPAGSFPEQIAPTFQAR